MTRQVVIGPDGKLAYADELPRVPPTRAQAKAAGQPRKSFLERVGATVKENAVEAGAQVNKLRQGFTLGLADPIAAGIIGGVEALENDTNFVDEYRKARGQQAVRQQRINEQAGTLGTVAEFAGGMAAPLGTGQRAVNAVNALRTRAGGEALGRFGQYVTRGGAQGATAGAATSLIGQQDFSDLGRVAVDTARDTTVGGLLGATLGVAAPAAASGVKYVNRLRKGAQGRVERALEAKAAAEEQIIAAIKRGGTIPAAESRIAAMTAQGAEPVIADASRTTRDAMRTLTDRGARGAQELEDKLVTRAERRGGRLRGAIEDISGISPQATTAAVQRANRMQRQAIGGVDYAPGGPLDNPFILTPQQNRVLTSRVAPGKPADQTFRRLYREAVETIKANPNFRAPGRDEPATARVIDETLRGYRQEITRLYKAGEGNKATALRAQFDELRAALRTQNPDYAAILDRQARGLAKERAVAEAEKLSGGIFTKPRETMDAIRQIAHPDDLNATRGVLLDKLFTQTGNRAAYRKLKDALSDPNQVEQRELIDFIMGGPQNTKRLQDWMDAERQGLLTEQRLGNSATTRNLASAEQFESDRLIAAGNAARAGAGVATGSPGMFANAALNSIRYGVAAARGANQAVVDPAMLMLMRRTAKPGDLTRMEQKALREAQRRAQRRAGPAGAVGRAGGIAVTDVTSPGNNYDEEY